MLLARTVPSNGRCLSIEILTQSPNNQLSQSEQNANDKYVLSYLRVCLLSEHQTACTKITSSVSSSSLAVFECNGL